MSAPPKTEETPSLPSPGVPGAGKGVTLYLPRVSLAAWFVRAPNRNREVVMSQIPGEAAANSTAPGAPAAAKREGIPQGLWLRCPECEEMLFRKVVDENLWVCPTCQ